LTSYRKLTTNLDSIVVDSNNLAKEAHQSSKKAIEMLGNFLDKSENFSEAIKIRDEKLKKALCSKCLKEFEKINKEKEYKF
jgi:hypothetical protein